MSYPFNALGATSIGFLIVAILVFVYADGSNKGWGVLPLAVSIGICMFGYKMDSIQASGISQTGGPSQQF